MYVILKSVSKPVQQLILPVGVMELVLVDYC